MATRDKMIITIDGPAGAGKSTVARAVAKKLGLPYLDSGSLYRAIAWKLDGAGIQPDEEMKIKLTLAAFHLELKNGHLYADGKDISAEIRTPRVDATVSAYAARQAVREALEGIERAQAKAEGLVADGRDMGTVVFPDAGLKIFLTANDRVRAERRYRERLEKGESADFEAVLKQVQERDHYDMTREIAPLRPASGCVILDSSDMTADEVVEAIASLARQLMSQQAAEQNGKAEAL